MCGRFGFSSSSQRVARRFNVAVPASVATEPRFNVAPTQNVLAITNQDPSTVTELRWGLVPFWATHPSTMKLTTFNARIETIATAPAYREPLRTKRCAILASGFYEWRRDGDGKKTPMWISRRDKEPFVFAGLWDRWRRGDTTLNSCTIVTQPPNELLAPIHSRMPVILHDDVVKDWLGPADRAAGETLELLVPQQPDAWQVYEVSPRVGNVRNDDASLIEPAPVA